MRRLLTDLRESASFLADLFKTALTETVRKVRPVTANGQTGPRDRPEAWTDLTGKRIRRPINMRDGRGAPGGGIWFG
jgi:hypothetical protein